MKYSYDKPSILINHWLVSKKDLQKLYSFFEERSKSKEVDFKLETFSGNNRSYDSFTEFESDVDLLVSEKEQIKSIYIGCSDWKDSWRTHTWVSINFENQHSSFHVVGEDDKQQVKDWIEAICAGEQRLVKVFQIDDEQFRKLLLKKYPSKDDRQVILDLDGSIKTSITEEIESKNKKDSTPIIVRLEKEKRSFFDLISNNGLAASVIGGLILTFIAAMYYYFTGSHLP